MNSPMEEEWVWPFDDLWLADLPGRTFRCSDSDAGWEQWLI